jgi:hypothetical protein
MYVFSEDIDPVTKKYKGPIEPLILRASAGDCITVNLTNAIDTASPPFSPRNWPTPFNNAIYGTVASSKYVGIQPQLLAYDGATSAGINVGYNAKPQAVASGEKITYNWYAGSIDRTSTGALTYTPIEFGSLNLLPTDPLMQHQWSLFGGMVIEPAGSKWTCDAQDNAGKTIPVPCEPGAAGYNPSAKGFTRASATVAAGSPFREFVAMVNEDLILNADNRSAINYRTEPNTYRYGNTDAEPQNFAADGNNTCATSDSLALPGSSPAVATGDPQTPIFAAKVGTPVRFRMMHPQGTGTAQVFTVNGHVWQREPYVNGSAAIGNNVISQWLGSHDSHGGTDHYDIVIDRAGGQNAVPGDYLYTTFVPNQNALGSWGLFRVLDKNGNKVPGNPVCAPTSPRPTPPKGRDVNDFLRPPFDKAVKQP